MSDALEAGNLQQKFQLDFSGNPPRILVVSGDLWWTRSIGSILKSASFEIGTAATAEEALQHLASVNPAAIIVHRRNRDAEALELIASLRREGFGAERPIILIPEQPLTREERLEVLRAGAWDAIGPPLGGEEMVLKLQAFLGAGRVVAAARQHALLDESSGLYNLHGILRWARELSNSAKRHSRPFGCAVFAPMDLESSPTDQPGTTWEDNSKAIALRLTTRGRSSDIVGRLSAREYIVLAPDADPQGIIEMANRFVRDDSDESGTSAIQLRAGCAAVENLATEAVEPAELIARATFALRRARTTEPEVVEFFDGSRGASS